MLKITNLSICSQENKLILLHDINFEVGHNEIHCILGKNGSGKSTIAFAILGLERYFISKGNIVFKGKNIIKLKTNERAKLGLALAFQEPARFEGLKVSDFLLAGRPKASHNELTEALGLVSLGDTFLDRVLDEKLSGGERKRIEIASVILMKPKLIIMDEPDASLDIIVYNEFYDLLLKIKNELKCSILLITHREEAALVADKATLIDEKTVVKTGSFQEVMAEYCRRVGGKCNKKGKDGNCLQTKKIEKLC